MGWERRRARGITLLVGSWSVLWTEYNIILVND